MKDVLIRGDGVAASCCAYLLARSGRRVAVQPVGRTPLPAILLSEAAQQLICSVFERSDLFRGLPAIRTRIVAWGPDAAPVALAHSAVVLSERELLVRLAPPEVCDQAGEPTRWTIHTSSPLPASVESL